MRTSFALALGLLGQALPCLAAQERYEYDALGLPVKIGQRACSGG